MNAGEWELEIQKLLDDLDDVQASLLKLLSQKKQWMARGEWSRLTETQPQEADLLQRLEQCHGRRQKLLEQARSVAPHVQNLRQLASWTGEDRQLSRRRFDQLAGRLRLLQHESLTNWVVAQRSLLHLAQMLEAFASGGRLKPTYGRETLPLSQGSLVDQEI